MFIQNLTAHVAFLVEQKISSEQYLLLYCLYLDKLDTKINGRWYIESTGESRPISNLYLYHSQRPWEAEEIQDLISKGFIRNRNSPGKYYPDNLEVTDLFINAIFARRKEFYEFLELYPDFTEPFNANDTRMIPLKMVGEEEIYEGYINSVNTKSEHSRMMNALRWGVDNNQITIKVTNFLQSRYWRSLEKLMDEATEESNSRGHMA